MCATSLEGVAARISPDGENLTTAWLSGSRVRASYSRGPIGECETRDEDGAEAERGGRSIVARYLAGTGEKASDWGRDDRNECDPTRCGVKSEFLNSSVADVRVYTELRRSAVPRVLKRGVPRR